MPEKLIPQQTADGSFTFFSEEFSESYHSHFGAKQESFQKFVVPTQMEMLAKKANKTDTIQILDICYGLGYNTAAALQTIWQSNPKCNVEVIGLEFNPTVPLAALNHNLYADWDFEYIHILTKLASTYYVESDHLKATLLIGDARHTIRQLTESDFQARAIFLDPFSPPQCPQLWTIEFLGLVSKCLHHEGLLATYSCSAAVRTGFLSSGLVIASTPPVGRKTPGTVAAHPVIPELLNQQSPLSTPELEHLRTRAAVPYRDPLLQDSAQIILERRRLEQSSSTLEATSSWRKRWSKASFTS
jgi:tRNA U34 5-methylaminomethyl-2-thiouridine-forming methyltransferase MnmC